MNFAPRAVPPSSWRRWVVDGVALATRRTGAFVTFAAGGVLLHALPAGAGLGVSAVPLVLGIGCVLAECSDHGRPILAALRALPSRIHATLAFAGLSFALGTWAVGALVLALASGFGIDPPGVPLPAAGTTAGSVVAALCASWLLSASVTLFGACVVLGFLIPLVAAGGLPLREAFVQTVAAIRLNPFTVFATAALAGTAVVGLLTPFLVIPWTAMVSAILYVAYRDVFLGRAENAPRARSRAVMAPASAAMSAAMSAFTRTPAGTSPPRRRLTVRERRTTP